MDFNGVVFCPVYISLLPLFFYPYNIYHFNDSLMRPNEISVAVYLLLILLNFQDRLNRICFLF
ncbi:hypothetical protein BJ944DRAFT_273799 [Cunninghamella echinulata]|nr:hypothetical protein BJ944DRAFT_273799 [Cunninghamella echinulata]